MRKRSLAVVPALVLLPLVLTACGGGDDTSSGASSDTSTTAAAATTTCSYPSDGTSASVKTPPSKPNVSGKVTAVIHTTEGDIPITLDAAGAPCTVNSFVSLVSQKYFDSTPCHRLTTSGIYVLQCGDPTGTGSGTPGYSFADELGSANALPEDKAVEKSYEQQYGQTAKFVTYPTGTLAMANAGADTNGSQFFLVYAPSTLNPNYTDFGTISSAGVAVLRKIAKAGESTGSGDGAPNDHVKITSVSVG